MIVLGIDPGSRYAGFGVVEQEGPSVRRLASGRIVLAAEPTPAARMARLAEGVEETLERWRPEAAVLETLFHGRNSRSLIALAQSRGVILSVLGRHGLKVHEYSPAHVKQAVCGSGRADKTQVSRMIDALLGPSPSPRSVDASDALAVALCYVHRRPLERVVEAARASPERG